MTLVVADTNALIAPFRQGFNIDTALGELLGAYEIVVPEPVLGELEKLAETKNHARAALRYARTRRSGKTRAAGDEAVLELAGKLGAHVMTNDSELIAKARAAGLDVIRLRGKSRLALVRGSAPGKSRPR